MYKVIIVSYTLLLFALTSCKGTAPDNDIGSDDLDPVQTARIRPTSTSTTLGAEENRERSLEHVQPLPSATPTIPLEDQKTEFQGANLKAQDADLSSCALHLLFERARMYEIMEEMGSAAEESLWEPQPITDYEGCTSIREYFPEVPVDFEFPKWLWVWPLQNTNCRTGDTLQHQNIGTLFLDQPYEVLSMNPEGTHVRVNIASINARCFVPLNLVVPGIGQWVIDRDELSELVSAFKPDGVPSNTAPDGSSSGDGDSDGDGDWENEGDQPDSSDPPPPTNTPCPVTVFPPCS